MIQIRKLYILIFCLITCLILTSCGNNETIDSLLSAPSLTREQSAVLSALSQAHSEHTTFIYPTTGSDRAAIHQLDIDGDGEEEAIAFFRDTDSGLNAHIAILEKEESGDYYISDELEGAGNGIASFSVINGGMRSSVLLIEWSSTNMSINSFAAFTYRNESLELGMEENCTDLIVSDLDGDGVSEFCYTTRVSDTGFALKCVKIDSQRLRAVATRQLEKSATGVKHVCGGLLSDGSKALFVDEVTVNGLQTEIFTFSNGFLPDAAFNEGYDIVALTQRPDSDYFTSRNMDGVTCVPSSVPPSAEIDSSQNLMYWYTVGSGNAELKGTAYMSSTYGISMGIPDEWASTCVVREKAGDSYAMTIYDTDDNELVTLLVLNVNDDSSQYTDEGFVMVGNSASNRFFCRFSCSDEETQYIKDNFNILRLGEN